MPTVSARSVRIAVARDGIRAHLLTSDVNPTLLTSQNITAALQGLKIPVSEEIIQRIRKIEQEARAGTLLAEPILLVEGREPTDGEGAAFHLNPALTPTGAPSEDDRVDFHRSQIVTVEAGTEIGTLEPEKPSTPGIDVYGKLVPAAPLLRSVRLAANVQLGADGRTVVASQAGKVHITSQQVSVIPVVEIAGDVDFATGNVDAPTDVLINGTVRDSFSVKSKGSITIRGAIEGAQVDAGTDLQVNGGIASRGQGKIVAAGEVFARFCNDCTIEAGGDVTITREALSGHIRTHGRLVLERGKLIGGKVWAREGADIFQLGNETNVRTEIALGVDPLDLLEVIKSDEAVKKKQEAIAKIRQNVQPLMAQLKRLTPAQRERATELLYQADSMEQEIQEAQKRKTAALKPAIAGGREVRLFVQKIAYPGVNIVFGDKVTTLHKERKGPFMIVRRLQDRVEEILLVDKLSGSVATLNSREYCPAEPVA